MCRQNDGAYGLVTEAIQGRLGKAIPGRIDGPNAWRFAGDDGSAFENEHTDLVRSIRAGEPLNEARQVAESTLTAIMGRLSAYTGKVVQWDWAMNRSTLDLLPKLPLQFGPFPTPPLAVPGETALICSASHPAHVGPPSCFREGLPTTASQSETRRITDRSSRRLRHVGL